MPILLQIQSVYSLRILLCPPHNASTWTHSWQSPFSLTFFLSPLSFTWIFLLWALVPWPWHQVKVGVILTQPVVLTMYYQQLCKCLLSVIRSLSNSNKQNGGPQPRSMISAEPPPPKAEKSGVSVLCLPVFPFLGFCLSQLLEINTGPSASPKGSVPLRNKCISIASCGRLNKDARWDPCLNPWKLNMLGFGWKGLCGCD